ncbi:MAG TPA: hypothetical protein DEH78_26810 [Solibacterales bacterium]|nr:hypothetical protein [Bryobacterales bacterium]
MEINARRFRMALLALVGAAALLLLARSFLGPIRIGRAVVHSPVALEGFISLALLLSVLLAPRAARHPPAAVSVPGSGRYALILAGLAAALLFVPNLAAPYLSDDYIHVARRSHANSFVAHFHSPGADGAFRPAGYLYLEILARAGGATPFIWHAMSLGLHLANGVLLYRFARRLGYPGGVASAACLLFWIHASRAEPVAWASAAFDLLAVLFALAAALILLPSRLGAIPAALLAALFTAASVWSKESTYLLPLVFPAIAAARGQRLRAVPLAVSAVVVAALLLHRFWFFAGPGGYPDPATGREALLSLNPVSTAKALLHRSWTILFFPVNWNADGAHFLRTAGLAFLCLGYGGVFAGAAGRIERRSVRWLLTATVLALLPAAPLLLIGDDALGSRFFYFAGVPFAILAADCAQASGSRRAAAALWLSLTVGHALLLEHNLAAWRRAAYAAERLCAEAADTGRRTPPPAVLGGVYLFANGFEECVAGSR